MRFLTWDAGILAGFCLLLAYSLIIRKHTALTALLASYIAYLVAATWGSQVADLFMGTRTVFGGLWINANIAPYQVEVGFFGLVALLIAAFLKVGGKRSKYGAVEVTIYVACATALVTLFASTFLDTAVRNEVLKSSEIVPFLAKYREWVLAAPVLAMVFFGIYREEE